MTLIVISPHTYVCIRPNNFLDLLLFPTNSVLVSYLINKLYKFDMINNQKNKNIFIYVT
jgi:hypothetical protein